MKNPDRDSPEARMPEGWEKLKSTMNEVTSEWFDFTTEEYKVADQMELALDFMKEMAEALDLYAHKWHDKKTFGTDLNEAAQVLKKFREWK